MSRFERQAKLGVAAAIGIWAVVTIAAWAGYFVGKLVFG